mmetsp:Transcript_3788/g.7864  ORF Transcript_3788/g.7864 Transcript_3788/m.7864 type:complete len:202 (-) Transcript_3788:574-1179(-)
MKETSRRIDISSLANGNVIPESSITRPRKKTNPPRGFRWWIRFGIGRQFRPQYALDHVHHGFRILHCIFHVFHGGFSGRQKWNNVQIVFVRDLVHHGIEIGTKGRISNPCGTKGAHQFRRRHYWIVVEHQRKKRGQRSALGMSRHINLGGFSVVVQSGLCIGFGSLFFQEVQYCFLDTGFKAPPERPIKSLVVLTRHPFGA